MRPVPRLTESRNRTEPRISVPENQEPKRIRNSRFRFGSASVLGFFGSVLGSRFYLPSPSSPHGLPRDGTGRGGTVTERNRTIGCQRRLSSNRVCTMDSVYDGAATHLQMCIHETRLLLECLTRDHIVCIFFSCTSSNA